MESQTTKHARMAMKLVDIDALVTFIKVWGSESTGQLPRNRLCVGSFEVVVVGGWGAGGSNVPIVLSSSLMHRVLGGRYTLFSELLLRALTVP